MATKKKTSTKRRATTHKGKKPKKKSPVKKTAKLKKKPAKKAAKKRTAKKVAEPLDTKGKFPLKTRIRKMLLEQGIFSDILIQSDEEIRRKRNGPCIRIRSDNFFQRDLDLSKIYL